MDDPSTNMEGAQGAEIGCVDKRVHMKTAARGSCAFLLQAVFNSHIAMVFFKLRLWVLDSYDVRGPHSASQYTVYL